MITNNNIKLKNMPNDIIFHKLIEYSRVEQK